MVRALASHQCGPGSSPGVICGLRLLLVLCIAPRDFPPGTPVFSSLQKPTFPNSNSTRNRVDENHQMEALPLNRYLFLFKKYIYISLRGMKMCKCIICRHCGDAFWGYFNYHENT